MKRLAIGCLCLASLVFPALADSGSLLTVDIPFAFNVGDAAMQTGQFQVSREAGNSVVIFRAADPYAFPPKSRLAAAASVMNFLGQQETDRAVTVVFNKYPDGRHFLAEIKFGNGSLAVTPSRTEREIITSTLIASSAPQRIEIAARIVK